MIDGQVTRVEESRGVALGDGRTFEARAVVLATGMDYAFPDIPGLDELRGKSVIHCPFCHGWEARDARIGLLASSDEHAAHLVPLLRRLSGDVILFEAVSGLRSRDGALQAVLLPDGSEVSCDFLFVAAPPTPRDSAFAHLPLDQTETGLPTTDEFGRTSLAGLYAAGDLVAAAPAVAQAIASGQRAAVGITRDLTTAP